MNMERALIEKAAEEYSSYNLAQSGFIAGAEWMSEQSGWVSVEDKVPNEGQDVLVLIMIDGVPKYRKEKFYRSPYIDHYGKWVHGNHRVISWMPIPPFIEK